MKLLVDAPSGVQELIEVGPGGGYFDETRVVWDERKDGPLPEVTVGGMKREGKELAFDPERLTVHEEASVKPQPPTINDRHNALVRAVAKAIGLDDKAVEDLLI